MKPVSEMSVGESKFFHAYMRRALIGWCAQGLANGDGSFRPTIPDDLPLRDRTTNEMLEAMVEYARSKKWVSKTSHTLLATAYKTAAGMMKVV